MGNEINTRSRMLHSYLMLRFFRLESMILEFQKYILIIVNTLKKGQNGNM